MRHGILQYSSATSLPSNVLSKVGIAGDTYNCIHVGHNRRVWGLVNFLHNILYTVVITGVCSRGGLYYSIFDRSSQVSVQRNFFTSHFTKPVSNTVPTYCLDAFKNVTIYNN